jgi:hypothetical protein
MNDYTLRSPGNHMIVKVVAQMMIVVLIFAGCATRRVGVEDQRAITKFREVLVRKIEYTPKGLPVVLDHLKARPSRAGDRFTVVQFINEHPVISFDIAVIGQNADFTKPFRVIYEWTGKGYQAGTEGSAATLNLTAQGNVQVHDRDEAVLLFAIILTPMVVGTTGGFIIGLADGLKTTVEEAGKVVLGNHEQVAAYTTYAYDAHDRLVLMRMFKADDSRQELVRTEYAYAAGESVEPLKTVITTYPSGMVRTLP